ncbi:CpsD/CapB family tyrosine-protein kinase [Cupriavidus basilensis]
MRAALHFSLRAAPDGVVAVTSPAVGAGKTFSAVNLAVLFAEAGQRVLLVDADLRRGKIADWFDQPAEGGLAEVLAGHAQLAEAVRPTVVNGLFILTRGQTPTNPSELLMLPTLADNLRRCASRFDLVIVDTPPVMAVADATLVASLVGSTLLVIRADVTPAEQVNETLKRLARADVRLAGGILNGVVQRRGNRADYSSINPYLGMPLPRAETRHPALTRPVDKA